MPYRRTAHALVLAVIVCAVAAGCRSHVRTRSFAVSAAPLANSNSPIEVEFVIVRDAKLMATLLEMTSRDWFSRRAQLKSDYPKDLETVSWEFVPGQSVATRKLPLHRRKAKALIVFANYFTAGPHRLRLDPFKRVTLQLGESDLRIDNSK
jgi:type VI secretion system protein